MSRLRNRSEVRSGSWNYRVGPDPVLIGTSESSRNTEQRVDNAYPRPVYTSKKKDRSLVTLPYSNTGHRVNHPKGDITWFDTLYTHNFWGIMGQSQVQEIGLPLENHYDGDLIDDLQDEVFGKLLDKIKSQKINLAQAFGERKQTASLLMDTALKFISAVKAARKGDMGAAAKFFGIHLPPPRKPPARGFRTQRDEERWNREQKQRRRKRTTDTKELSSRVLELQFGWKPLLQDLFGACEQIAKQYLAPTRHRVTSAKTKKLDASLDTVAPPWGGMINHHVTEESYSVKGSIVFGIDSEAAKLCTETGLRNPAAVAWELTPWSFVIDYFISIGDYLDRLDATDGVQFQSGTISTSWRFKCDTICLPGGHATNPLFQSYGGVASGQRRKFRLTRNVLNGFPPAPCIKVKENPLSPGHVVNLLALFRQGFRVK